MVVWSSCIRPGTLCVRNLKSVFQHESLVKSFHTSGTKSGGHGGRFEIKPSTWQWRKFKDFVHYYVMVGAIPVTAILLYTNIVIGPATLTEIPEGYVPHHWEYHRHPITRFIAKYFHPSPQEVYEKKMDMLYEEDEKMKLVLLTEKVNKMQQDKMDLQVYYYKPVSIRAYRRAEESEYSMKDTTAGYDQ